MRRIWKALVFLVLVGLIALIGFAYFGDLTPEAVEHAEPVTLDLD